MSRLHDFSRLGCLDIFLADVWIVICGRIRCEVSEVDRLEVGPG